MEITKSVKLANGVEFTAKLNEEQLDYLLAIAINVLMASGSMAFSGPPPGNKETTEEGGQLEFEFEEGKETIN